MIKSKNVLKKIEKKQKRAENLISKDIGVEISKEPTNNLLICNYGLVNGLSREEVLQLFNKYGPIVQVQMLQNKSYCFTQFREVSSALKAFKALNGEICLENIKHQLYLTFVKQIPTVKVPDQSMTTLPNGLKMIENFINENEEQLIVSFIKFNDDNNCLKNRQVLHYGYEFRYDTNNVDKDRPLEQQIPKEFQFIIDRLNLNENYRNFQPDQLTVNKYLPGQGIPFHVDTHSAFEDIILSLSLCSSIQMDFRHRNGNNLSLCLPNRSLLIMSAESRYDWYHGIVPRILDPVTLDDGSLSVKKRQTRISLTFRKVLRSSKCQCDYPEECDSIKKNAQTKDEGDEELKNETPEELELNYVHNIYEEIASHFSETRHKAWPKVVEFLNSFKLGDILLDVGCGNGKYLNQNPFIFNIGCDRSMSLLNICKSRDFEVFNCDCLNIPIRDNQVDGCICIAVIHHLATQERRKRALLEMIRVLKIGGRGLVYVWAKDQISDEMKKSSYLKHNEIVMETNEINVNKLPVHVNKTEFKHKDLLVPWKLNNKLVKKEFLRFYHVFDKTELYDLLRNLRTVTILDSYYDEGNRCVIFKKI